jgi:hypothetical protein
VSWDGYEEVIKEEAVTTDNILLSLCWEGGKELEFGSSTNFRLQNMNEHNKCSKSVQCVIAQL